MQRQAVDLYDGEDKLALAGLQYDLAIFLLLDRQYRAAIQPFKAIVDETTGLAPNHRAALNNYAYLLADELRRPEEALPYANRARALLTEREPASQQADVLDTLGWIHYLLGDSSKAENVLRESMSKHVTASNCYHLAAVLAEMDRLDAARNYLDRAAELRPDPRTKAEIDALADDIRTRRK
ncbi:MAG: tetratricopeptide repeat protein [Planctomycetota bacterium]